MDGEALVERLRRDELDSIESEVSQGRRAHILKTLDERGRAQELVRQQYTGRYPFELLQNANDAAGDAGASGGSVRFLLTKEALVVADEGSGFGSDQIRAICGLGRSSKDPRKSIGYKGLGFKSVGEITNRPQIISSDVRFTFDEERLRSEVQSLAGDLFENQRLPVYAFPFGLTDEELGEDHKLIEDLRAGGFRTILRLPFKPGVEPDAVQAHVQATITPKLLLFLDAVDQLELVGTGHDFSAMAVRQPQDGYVETLLEAEDAAEHWLIFERRIPVPDRSLVKALGDAWKEVEQVRVAAAVQLDHSGSPSSGPGRPLHVYFPTQEQGGFPFILQADFALELDRRHIARSPEAEPYNAWLAQQLGQLIGEHVAPLLAKRFPRNAAVVASLAPQDQPSGFGQVVWDHCVDCLKSSVFVPCMDGELRSPGQTVLLPGTVPSCSEAHAALEVADWDHLVLPEIEDDATSRDFLSNHLESEELDLDNVLGRFKSPTPEEETRFYEFLVSWSEKVGMRAFGRRLAEVPCVRTLGGQWKAPKDGVFFPRQRGEVEFPEELRVPIAHVPEVEGLRALLEAAGVRPFEWRSLLPDFVLPLLLDEDSTQEIRGPALQAVRAYYETERSGDPRLKAQLARILLPAARSSGGGQTLRQAQETYFSARWLRHDRLEQIYGPFEEPEFLAVIPPEDDEARRSEAGFYRWLGVAASPRVDEKRTDQRDTYMLNSLYRHPHREYGEQWEDWRRSDDFQSASRCGQGHSESQQLRASYGLDRFPDLVASADPPRLALLWLQLAAHWGPVYQAAMSAEFYCQATAHSGDALRLAPSLFSHMLRRLDWVPCLQNREPVLVPPSRAWRVTSDTPRRIAERVPVLDRTLDLPESFGLAGALGVVDAARPDPDDLAALLEDLAEEHAKIEAEEEEDPSSIYTAARWVMRTLSGVLEEGKELAAEAVPLLARTGGRHVFDTAPFVSEDPLLAETWESTHPILDADRDLRALHRALGLRSLDSEVRVRPVPERPRPDLRDQIERRIVQAKPYLAAVAAEAVPSRREDVFRGLARLEVAVCEDLILEYELDGEVRQRPEAVSYIAVRIEQEGSVRRRIGTAHLELSHHRLEPHWYAFGPQLAQFLGVPTQDDAFALLLAAGKEDRHHYLTARRISLDAVEEARVRLDQPPEDEVLDDLLEGAIVPGGGVQMETRPEGGAETTDAGKHPEEQPGSGDAHPEPTEPPPAPELPPIDPSSLQLVDAPEEAEVRPPSGPAVRRPGGLGPSGPVDLEKQDRLQRLIGKRGEEAAFHAERARLEGLGFDPEAVVWRSQEHPYAPYDIESLDADGQRIYIEVKSAASDDPTDAFEISEAELLCALQKRSNYYVYRVTEAHTASPSITRYQDPIARIRAGRAHLRLSGARLAFADGPPDKDSQATPA